MNPELLRRYRETAREAKIRPLVLEIGASFPEADLRLLLELKRSG